MSISTKTLNELNEMFSRDIEFIERKKITELSVGKAYTIKKMASMTTRFGKCLLVALQDPDAGENVTFETFLPKRVAETLSDDIVDTMSKSSGKYTITYLGQGTKVFGNNTRTLLSFGTLE